MRRLQKSIATALWRRHIAQTFFRSEARTGFRQALNEAQETTLLGHLRWLVAREILSHPAIVRNIVEEIYGGDLGKHWVARFIQRHFFPSVFSSCFMSMCNALGMTYKPFAPPRKHVYAKYQERKLNMPLYFIYFTIR